MLKKSTVKKSITVFVSVLLGIMILFVIYLALCTMNGKVAFIGGQATVKIVSPSMEPQIPVGTYILADKIEAEDVSIGDVILFISKDPAIYGKINTHRVVEITTDDNGERSFVTKGDNNPVNDKLPVPQSDLLGRYSKNLPTLTKFAEWFSNPLIFGIFIILPAIALIFFSVLDLVKKSKEVKMQLLIQKEVEKLKASESDIKNQNKE